MAVAVMAELLMVRVEIWSEHETGEGEGSLLEVVLWRVAAGDADGWLFGEDSRHAKHPRKFGRISHPDLRFEA
jgi:hypothetical protein